MSSVLSEIGFVPENSDLIELGQLLECVIDHRGKTPKKLGGDWIDQGIPAISAKNVHDGVLTNQDAIRFVSEEVYKKWMKEDVKNGDILIASEGATMGEYLYWNFDYPIVLSQRLFCIRADETRLYSNYLYAYVRSKGFQSQLSGMATGTSVQGIRQVNLLKIKIPVIPMDQQVIIGDSILDFERKISINRKMNETLEQMAQALFKSWFVDFDPILDNAIAKANSIPDALQHKAQQRREIIASSKYKALPKEIMELFPSSFEYNDELEKWIPNGWNVNKLSDYIDVKHGFAFKGEYFSTVPTNDILLTPGNFKIGGGFKGSKFKYYKGDYPKEYVLNEFDIVITMTDLSKEADTLGYPAFVPQSNTVRYLHNQRLGKVEFKSDALTPCYLFYQLCAREYRSEIVGGASGTTVKHTSPSKILNFSTVLPSNKSLLKQFDGIVKRWHEKMHHNFSEITTLTRQRDVLLPQLISGKLRVNKKLRYE